jgi:uncharacterized protein YrzB (UPF0473 family)
MSAELEPRRIVTLYDEETKERASMEVYIELDIDQRQFALLFPVDIPTDLLRVCGDDQLEPIDDGELAALVKHVNAAFRDTLVSAEVADGVMVLKGDPPEEFFDDCEIITGTSQSGEEEEFAVLLELDTGGDRVLLLTPLVPALTPAELLVGDSARTLTDDEWATLEETFQEALAAVEEEDDA